MYFFILYFLSQVNQVSINSPALLLVDPAYHGNVGDNIISYGELVLMERLGFTNHTECHIHQSLRRSQSCNNFSQFEAGGLAWWQGGGNWGDLWSRNTQTLRLCHFLTFTLLLAADSRLQTIENIEG